MKRLLVFCGGYYPSYGAPGIVLEKLLPTLKQHFEVTILTVRRKKHTLGNPFNYNGIAVYEVSDWLQNRCVEWSGLRRAFWRFVQEIRNAIVQQPMFAYNIRKTVAQANALHAERPFDCVFSVAFPPYAHIAAQKFAASHPALPWAAYSTDTLFDHKMLKSKWLGWQLKAVLKKEMAAYRAAKAVLFTPEIFAWKGRMFPRGEVKPRQLEYTLTLDAERCPGERVFSDDGIHLVYAGAFYENLRDPRWFLAVVEKVLKKSVRPLHFHFYLLTGVFRSEVVSLSARFPENVIIHSAVQPAEMKRIMNAADVLLNFSNDADQFSPSKLFDYIATGRPILNVAYPNRKVNPVLERYPLALTLANDGDVAESAERVSKFVASEGGRRISADEIRSLYSKYLAENVAMQVVEALT